MKLLRMRLKNLNSFKREVELNFEENPLNDASLLAITGPTGSGKTTLLDALCAALYNKTPRLEGRGNRSVVNLLSQSANEGFSEVLFEANGTRYLSEWIVKRNKRGDLKQTGKLIYADTEKLITNRLTPRRNAEELSDMSIEGSVSKILGLDFNAFNRSVMLAQGEFAAFLKAEPEKKREILEATTGMDLYEQLKDVLNEKVKNVEAECSQAESALNSVPPVSQEEIDSTDKLLKKLDEELEQLDGERRRVAAEKVLETQRTRAQTQLLDAERKQKTLLTQKDEIDSLEKEIERARRAADIRSERDSFEREKENVREANIELQNSRCTLDESQKAYEESQTKFSKADEAWKNAKEESAEKFEVIAAAREEEIQAQSQFAEEEKRREDIGKSQKTIAALEKSIKTKKGDKKLLEGRIEKDENFLKTHPLPDNSEELLANASEMVGALKGMEKNLQEKTKARKGKETVKSELQKRLGDLQEERKGLEEEKMKAEGILKETQRRLSSLYQKGSEADWERQKDDAQKLQEHAAAYEDASQRLREVQTLERETRESLETVLKELNEIAKEVEIKAKDVQRAEGSVKRYEAEEKYALISNQVVVLRKEHLEVGKPCPVCGAVEHPWAEKEEPEGEKLIEEARANLANAQKELRKLQEDRSELEKEGTSKETTKAKLQQELQKFRDEIENLNVKMEAAQNQWRQVYPEVEHPVSESRVIGDEDREEISSKLVRTKIREADNYLKNINSAKIAETNAQNNLNLLIQKLENNRAGISNADSQLNDVEGEIRALIGEIEYLTEDIAQTKEQFWGLIPVCVQPACRAAAQAWRTGRPEEFRKSVSDAPEDGLRKFSERISAVKQCSRRLERNRPTLEGLKTSIKENEKTLAGEKARLEDLKSQANQYIEKGKRLLDSAKAKTGGLKADEARRNLEAELRRKEEQRNKFREDLQRKENRLTQAKTSLNEAKGRLEISYKTFKTAEAKYIESFKQAGFASPEEHREAFRESGWFEEANQTVENYHRDVHSIQQEIETLEKTFAQKPFNPEELASIQKKENEIEVSIKAKREQKGGLGQKINQLRQDLKLRREREASLQKAEKERDRWAKLRTCMPANELRDFALKSMFDLLIRFANKQLDDLTGRYMLKVKDMRDMVVVDKWNAAEVRPVETLSGGESFLTSLSLALALSELSKGRTQIDSLFLDEGFGTLDTETLDIALSALEGLRLSGTSIVVISHIGELTRRIPVRIAVKKMGDGSSRVDIEGGI